MKKQKENEKWWENELETLRGHQFRFPCEHDKDGWKRWERNTQGIKDFVAHVESETIRRCVERVENTLLAKSYPFKDGEYIYAFEANDVPKLLKNIARELENEL